jgi:hypothetical protein
MSGIAGINSIADMANDALEVHYEDGCCERGGQLCDEAVKYVLPMFDRPDAHQGMSAVEAKIARESAAAGFRPSAGAKAGNQYGTFKVHPASDAQARFLKTCLETRDLTLLNERGQTTVRMARVALEGGTISKKLASSALDYVAKLPLRAGAEALTGRRKASERQTSLIGRLLAERDLTNTAFPAWATGEFEWKDLLDPKEASKAIDMLFALPKAQVRVAAPAAELASGIYKAGDSFYKVYWNQGKTRMLAKRLVLGELGEDGRAIEDATWEYAGMASRFVTADQQLSLEEAKAFGRIYGVCCACGAMLTDEKSIDNGIGPVCGKRFAA